MTQKNSSIIILGGIISLLICILLNSSAVIFLAVITAWILIILLLISLEAALFALILIRPSIDILSSYTLPNIPFINLGSLIAIISIFLSIIYLYKHRDRIHIAHIPFFWSILLLLMVYSILSVTGVSIMNGLQETVRTLSFLLLYFVGWVYISSQDKLIHIIRLTMYGSIIPLTFAYIEYFSGSGLYTNPGFENRIAGTFGHPNVLAYYSVIILTIIIAVWVNKRINISMNEKRLLAGIGGLYGIILLITFTRGAWFGMIMLASLVSFIRYPRKSAVITSAGLGIISILLVLYQLLSPPTALDLPPLTTLPVINRVAGLFTSDPSDSVIWRLVMWQDMYKQAWESPIIGFGTGSSEIMVEQTRGIFRGSLEVHNDYIKIFLEQGVVGLITYIILILNILIVLFYRYIRYKETYMLLFASLMTIIYTVSLWDNLLRGTVLMWILFFLLGGILRYQDLSAKSSTI